jgi:hypothetical protein
LGIAGIRTRGTLINVGPLRSDNKAPPSLPNHSAGFYALLAPKGMIMFSRHENRQEHEGRNGAVLPEIEDEFRELVRRGTVTGA